MMPDAEAIGGASARPSVPLRGKTIRREGRPYGEYDTDHQQQELLVVVAARLAAREILRPALRGGRYLPRRRLGAGRNPAVVVVDPGAVPAARGRYRLGHAGDR